MAKAKQLVLEVLELYKRGDVDHGARIWLEKAFGAYWFSFQDFKIPSYDLSYEPYENDLPDPNIPSEFRKFYTKDMLRKNSKFRGKARSGGVAELKT